jgi:hypothetical protein
MSPVKYELGFHISEDDILHSHRRKKPEILHSINRLDCVAETQCVSCEVRTGFSYCSHYCHKQSSIIRSSVA